MIVNKAPQTSLALLLLLVPAACMTPAVTWQKPGTDETMITRETSECRAFAEQEAVRRYPYGFSSPAFGPSGVVMSQQRDSANRATAEIGFFNSCMQNRGYARTRQE